MRNITVVIREVTEWREVGVKLGIKPYKLEEIRLNRMNDVQHCKVRTCTCTCTCTVEPPNNGRDGSSTFVHYSEVSFMWRFFLCNHYLSIMGYDRCLYNHNRHDNDF